MQEVSKPANVDNVARAGFILLVTRASDAEHRLRTVFAFPSGS